MATFRTVTGTVLLPVDGTVPQQGVLRFTLTGFDTEGADLIAGTVFDTPINADTGAVSVDLWTPDEGEAGLSYTVVLQHYVPAIRRRDEVYLGVVTLTAGVGSVDLTALLSVPPPAPVTADVLALALAAAASAQADAADAAASAAAADGAEAAQIAAEAARDAALLSRGVFVSTAAGISNGVAAVTVTGAGTGGTNGVFALAFSGGGGTGAAGTFTVSGGAIVSVSITNPGTGYTSAPTVSFAASSGLSGATATVAIAPRTPVGGYFSVPASGDDSLILYRVDAGPVAVEVIRYPSATTTRFRRPLTEQFERLAQYEPQLAFASGGAIQTGFNTYTVPASGDCQFWPRLFGYEIGSTTVDVVIRVTSGTPSAITIDQRNSSNVAIAGTSGTASNEGNGIWARRGLTLDAAFAWFRVRVQNGAGSPDVLFEAPVIVPSGTIPVTPARRSDTAVAAALAATAADQQRNFWSPQELTITSGSGVTLSGRTCIMPIGSRAQLKVDASQFAPSDTVTLIFHASGPHRIDTFDIQPHTNLAGGGGTTLLARIRSLGNGWYVATRANSEAASGAQAVQFWITLDNRTGGVGQSLSGTLTLTHFWLGRNVTEFPSVVTAPAAVAQALGESGALTLWVDPAGSDSNAGSQSSPLATVAAAVNAGAGRVMLRKASAPHRLSTGLTISRRIEFVGYSGIGDTQTHARVWSSENLAAAQFTATAADANVFYRAMAASPGGIWESTASGLVRFGRVQADPLGVRAAFAQPEANEAAVRAGAGRWWWGAGSQGTGLYLRPTGDSFTGRSYECPVANATLALTGADIAFDGVEVGLGRANVATVSRSTVRSRRSRFMRSGTSDGISFASDPSHWLDEGDCLFAEAGDDGVDTNGGGAAFVSLGGSISRDNVGDGVAPHGTGQTVRLQGMRITANGKQGFVSVGTGTFDLVDCDCRGNADADILIAVGALTAATTVRLDGCAADETAITANTASTITATVTEHRGPIQAQANVTVRGHRVIRQGADALRVSGGLVDVEDFHYSGATDGVDLSAGTLTLRTGQILRCTTGMRQSGGTLTLDGAAPVNVFGNATQFNGVSSGDQALTVSLAAV